MSLKNFFRVHFVVATPEAAHAVVKCLAESEITNDSIVWLITEKEFLVDMDELAVRPIRVDEFVLQKHHQVIVATHKTITRLPLSPENRSHPSSLLIVVYILFCMLSQRCPKLKLIKHL